MPCRFFDQRRVRDRMRERRREPLQSRRSRHRSPEPGVRQHVAPQAARPPPALFPAADVRSGSPLPSRALSPRAPSLFCAPDDFSRSTRLSTSTAPSVGASPPCATPSATGAALRLLRPPLRSPRSFPAVPPPPFRPDAVEAPAVALPSRFSGLPFPAADAAPEKTPSALPPALLPDSAPKKPIAAKNK